MSIYDFTVRAQDGSDVALADYSGKVLLVVNTATDCGFTPQYEELQEAYEELHGQGFEILDFPCNQFAGQAPGDDEEIHGFCTGRYGITFPQFAKVDVVGDTAIPLFRWIAANTKFEGFEGAMGLALKMAVKKMDKKNYKSNNNIKWNFTKVLIGRDGRIIARFEPTAPFERVKAAIEKAL